MVKRKGQRRSYSAGDGIDEFFGACAKLINGTTDLIRETKALQEELEDTKREIEDSQQDYPECFGQALDGWGYDEDDEECENCPLADECKDETGQERKKAQTGEKKRHSAKIEEPIVVDLDRARALLGVTPDASEEDIRDAYVKLIKKTHPDRSKDPEATKKTQEINAAYELLTKDAIRRDSMR